MFLSSHPFQGQANWNVQVAEIALLGPNQNAPVRSVWESRSAVDITPYLTQGGKLEWQVPDGKWKILRIGTTLHGAMTQCVGSGPTGLEIDTMSAEAMDAHFAETGANALEIEVANLWPNRLIGDATLPKEQRRTVTNVRTFDTLETPYYGCPKCTKRKKDGQPADLLPSGLLGPVRLMNPSV